MQRERLTRKSQTALLVGWISNTDSLFVGLILMLAVTLAVASRLQWSEGKTRQMQDTAGALEGQLRQADSQIADMEVERNRLRKENSQLSGTAAQVGPLQSRIDALQTQLAKLKASNSAFETERNSLQQ